MNNWKELLKKDFYKNLFNKMKSTKLQKEEVKPVTEKTVNKKSVLEERRENTTTNSMRNTISSRRSHLDFNEDYLNQLSNPVTPTWVYDDYQKEQMASSMEVEKNNFNWSVQSPSNEDSGRSYDLGSSSDYSSSSDYGSSDSSSCSDSCSCSD